MFHLVVQTRYNQWQHGDRFSAALRLQTGTCAKRYVYSLILGVFRATWIFSKKE